MFALLICVIAMSVLCAFPLLLFKDEPNSSLEIHSKDMVEMVSRDANASPWRVVLEHKDVNATLMTVPVGGMQNSQPPDRTSQLQDVLHVLSTAFGGPKKLVQTVIHTPMFSRETKSLRRSLRTEARKSFKKRLQQHADDTAIDRFMMFPNADAYDRDRLMRTRVLPDEKEPDDASRSSKRRRLVQGGYNVCGPRDYTGKTITEMIVADTFLAGTFHERKTEFKLPKRRTRFKGEGNAQFRDLRQTVTRHLEILLKKKIFLQSVTDCSSDEKSPSTSPPLAPINICVRLSEDGSKMSKFSIMSSPMYGVCVSVMDDPPIFRRGFSNFVTMALPVILALERENILTVRYYAAQQLLPQIKSLSSTPIQLNLAGRAINFNIILLVGSADCEGQQFSAGVGVARAECRCYMCDIPGKRWSENTILGFDQNIHLRTIVRNYADHHGKNKTRGIMRTDKFIPDSVKPEQLSHHLESHGLSAFQRLMEPVHLIENHSNLLLPALCQKIDKSVFVEIEKLINQHLHIPFLLGKEDKKAFFPTWRWRLIWASSPVTWRPVLSQYPQYHDLLEIVESFSMMISILGSKPEHRNVKTWLRYASACHIHFTLCKQSLPLMPFRLSEHLIYPHSIYTFWEIDFYNLSTERHESLWKPVRSWFKSSHPNNHNRLALIMARLTHSLYKNVDHPNGIKRPNRISPTLFDQYWRGHFTHRTRFKHSPVFEELLLRMGIQENVWWHREDQDIILHDATNDKLHEHPIMPSLLHSIQDLKQRTQDQITLLDSMIHSATTHGMNDRKQKAQQAKVRKQERDKLKQDQHQQHPRDPHNSSCSSSSSDSRNPQHQPHLEPALNEEKQVMESKKEARDCEDIVDEDEDDNDDGDDDHNDDNKSEDVGARLYDEVVDASLDYVMFDD